MMNMNPATGVRYGVISGNSLDPDVYNELFYGAGAKDLSYQEAYYEARAEAEGRLEDLMEEARIAAAETGADRELGYDPDAWAECWFQENGHGDSVMFVEDELEKFSDMYQCDEPVIEGELDGTKYVIGWLGGAPIIYITWGCIGYTNRLCSPCVPNAADLDSGFTLDNDGGYECYVPPRSWLRVEEKLP